LYFYSINKSFLIMSLILTAAGLLASGIGAGVNAYQNAKNQKDNAALYERQRGQLLTDLYSSPYDNLENKALLSQAERRYEKNLEAVENQAAAGGATFENKLAAKQANNEAMADMYAGMAQGLTARRDATKQQLLNLDAQRVAQQNAARQQSGQAWATMGNNAFGAFTDLGGVMLENGLGFKDLLKWNSGTGATN
jgi:hypothetical protein